MSSNPQSPYGAGSRTGAATKTAATAPVRRLGVGAVVVGSRSRFRITEEFKAGGMGETYLGLDEGTGSKVVVKVVQARLLASSSESAAGRIVKRFEREIRTLWELKGLPHVVDVLDDGTIKDAEGAEARFFAIEFIDGVELRKLLPDRGPTDLGTFAAVGRQLLEGLAQIHERRQSHRDIKPENVMVARRPDGAFVVKYIDFGLGRPVFGGVEQVTRFNDRVGPNDYVAPELSTRFGDIKDDEVRQADVYSTAVLLYRMATGSTPIPSDAPPELRRRPPEPKGGLAASLTPELRDALRRALLPQPKDRPTSAELRDLFDAFATTARVVAPPRAPASGPTQLATETGSTMRPTLAEPDPPTLPEGRELAGRYRVDGTLGEGSMGVVYKATDLKLRRTVAIKVAHDRRALVSEEAENLAQVEHQNIVRVIDVGEDRGTPFIVMEYVGGETLAEMVATGEPLDYETLRAMSLGIVDGLRFAHGKGVQHNDLGPNNVKWDGEKRTARILDFGIAEGGASEGKAKAKATNLAVLTPDQILGVAGEASDLYQVGILLYVMATGREPYLAASIDEYKEFVLRRKPEEPVKVNPALRPAKLSGIIMKCLEKLPDDRYASAEHLYEALEEAFTPEGTGARWPGMLAVVLAAVIAGLLAAQRFKVWPFKPEAAPPTAEEILVRGLGAADPKATVATTGPVDSDGRRLVSAQPTLAFDVATGSDALVWADVVADVYWKKFLRAEARPAGGGPALPLEITGASRGLEVSLPPNDGRYDVRVLLELPGAEPRELGSCALRRDTTPPVVVLERCGDVALSGEEPWVQFRPGETSRTLTLAATDDDATPELKIEGLTSAPAVRTANGAEASAPRRAYVAEIPAPQAPARVEVVARDRAGNAAAKRPALRLLPAATVLETSVVVGSREQALTRAAGGASVPATLDASKAEGAAPSLRVRLAPLPLAKGERCDVRVRPVAADGTLGAELTTARRGGDDSKDGVHVFDLSGDAAWKDARLRVSYRIGSFELADAFQDFVCDVTPPAVTFGVVGAAERELDAGPEGAFIAVPAGGKVRVFGAAGAAVTATAVATAADAASSGFGTSEVAAPDGRKGVEITAPDGGAAWFGRFDVRAKDATSGQEESRVLRIGAAPFGVRARVDGAPQEGMLAPAERDGRTEWWFRRPAKSSFEIPVVVEGVEAFEKEAGPCELLAGDAAVDRAARKIFLPEEGATLKLVLRNKAQGVDMAVPIRVGDGARSFAEATIRRDDAPPKLNYGGERRWPRVPKNKPDFKIDVEAEDVGVGLGDGVRLKGDAAFLAPWTPHPSGDGRRVATLQGERIKVGAEYVVADLLGNATTFKLYAEIEDLPEETTPPVVIPLDAAIVKRRLAACDVPMRRIDAGGASFWMMEFELTGRNVTLLKSALTRGDEAFAGTDPGVRNRVSIVAAVENDEPARVLSIDAAKDVATALGLEVPTKEQWTAAACGGGGCPAPRREGAGDFPSHVENGANLRLRGGESVKPRSWFTVPGLFGLKAMAGNAAEIVVGGGWIGGDVQNEEPLMAPVRNPTVRGARFLTTKFDLK